MNEDCILKYNRVQCSALTQKHYALLTMASADRFAEIVEEQIWEARKLSVTEVTVKCYSLNIKPLV